ncbi:uncharacterized protein LOC110450192 isoform X1 [Mizuhopecten yessoensis]|nr:uncharacterized protein LOC110450192 isoform X1 [Mizuhopecten yessoensis]XP_021353195.1 uncharacterized protein LOC110450192 isoform X1 [Mizuhopecten yessoensis]
MAHACDEQRMSCQNSYNVSFQTPGLYSPSLKDVHSFRNLSLSYEFPNFGDFSTVKTFKDKMAYNAANSRRGSGPVASAWVDPLASSANPIIQQTHPSTPKTSTPLPGRTATSKRLAVRFQNSSCVTSSDDPVMTFLLKILHQLEEDREEEMVQRKKERRQWREKWRLRQLTGRGSDTDSDASSDNDLDLSVFTVEQFQQMKIRMAQGHSLGPNIRKDISKTNGISSMVERLKDLTMADIDQPEHAAWLFDQGNHKTVWCVVADMLFCIFESKTSERPQAVVLLPGCSVRSLVYSSAATKPNQAASKTISGLDKYQIILDDSGTHKKYLFSVQKKSDLLCWMAYLKPASNLENDAQTDASNGPRRHSVSGPVPILKGEAQTHVTPKYAPSARTSVRTSKLVKSESFTDGVPVAGAETLPSPERETSSPIAGTSPPKDSLGDFRRRLRRDTEPEIVKTLPVKATHFQKSSPKQKKSSTFRKLRSFGSLDSLFKKKSPKDTDSTDSNSLDDNDGASSLSSSIDFVAAGLIDSGPNTGLGRPQSRKLSRSLDFGKSEKGLSKGIMRTASDLKDKLKRNKPEIPVILKDLQEIRMSGYLQQKYLLKWHKLWCVVCRGCMFGFKSMAPDESATVAVVLNNSKVEYMPDQEKRFKKSYVFKVSHQNRKSVYFNAVDNTELSNWLQCLQMEASKVKVDKVDKCKAESKLLRDYEHIDGYSNTSSITSSSHSRAAKATSAPPKIKFRSSENSPSTKDDIRTSLPNGRTNGDRELSGTDADFSSSAEEWGLSSLPIMPSKNSFGLPVDDFPEHDPALKEVWQKDRNYLFNLVRAKLRGYRKRRESDVSGDIPGPNNEGLMVVNEDVRVTNREPKSRNLRRTKSVSVTPSSSSASGQENKIAAMATKVDNSPEASPASRRKKHKALLVKKIAAKEIEEPVITGYMERRNISEQWLRYWFVLKGSSLFCYLTPDDSITVDLLDVRGYGAECLVDRFRGKRFVLHLTHEEYVSVHLSIDNRDDMEEWKAAIQEAAGDSPSPQAVTSETVIVEPTSVTDGSTYEDKCVSVKQKLLNEMLRQKHELERKQAARQRRSHGVESPNKDLSSVEKQITYATHIRQRRLSTQIKMETITKQLHSQTTSSKRFPFSFGGKKKTNNQDHLKGQLQELNNKLQQIDLDLTSHINKSTSKTDLLDMNQNRKSNGNGVHEHESRVSDDASFAVRLPPGSSNGTKDDSDMNKTNTLKNSVQKLAQKTFSRSVKSKKSKRSNDGDAITNGYLSDSMVIDRHRHGLENGDPSTEYDSEDGTETHKADSLTDLTTTNTSFTSDDNVFDNKSDSGGTKFKSRKSNSSYSSNSSTHSQASTPRKEVDPNIMAEIDAFEDFTKQIMGMKL